MAIDIPKLVHIGIDRWKLEQIMNLYEGATRCRTLPTRWTSSQAWWKK